MCRHFIRVNQSSLPPFSSSIDSVATAALADALHQCRSTLRHIPKGILDEFTDMMCDLLASAVETRSAHSVLTLFMMPAYVLAPIPRGGSRHSRSTVRLLRRRMADYSSNLVGCFPPNSNPRRPVPRLPSSFSNLDPGLRRAVLQSVSDMALSKACHLLQSSENSLPDDVEGKLRSLFPPADAPNCAPLNLNGDVDITESTVEKSIRSFPPGSGSGPSGLRPAHLKDMLTSRHRQRLLVTLVDFVSCLCNGGFSPSVVQYVAAAKLFGIGKKLGGVRPIACGETLRRVAARCLLSSSLEGCLEYLQPLQMGVKTPNATETIARDVAEWAKCHPSGELLLQVDLKNAFNCVSRSKMLEAVREHAAAFYPYASSFYGQRSRMCGQASPIWSEQGVQQGDVCGPLLFSVAIHQAVRAAAAAAGIAWSRWYLDDGHLRGSSSHLETALHILQVEFEKVGLEINLTKCCLFGDADVPSSSCPLLSTIPHRSFSDGIVVLGCPVGSPAFRAAFLAELQQKMECFFTLLRTVDDVHAELLIMRSCTGACRVNHLLRVLPFEDGQLLAQKVSLLLHEQLSATLHTTTTPLQFDLACLPLRYGGLGLRDPKHEAAAALLSSTLSYLRSHSPTAQLILTNPDVSAAYRWVQDNYHLHSNVLDEIAQLPADVVITTRLTFEVCQQKHWNHLCADARVLLWEPLADARLRCVRLCNFGGQSDPLGSFRNEDTGNVISNHEWMLYVRFRLGLFLTDVFAPRCPACATIMDRCGDHALSCKSLGVYGRHNAVRNAIASIFADSGLKVQTEVPAPRCALRPADVLVDGLDFDPTALDIAVVHELQPSLPFATVANASSVEQEEERKRSHFARLHQQLHWRFRPMVVNTMGSWGRSATTVVHELIKRRVQTHCTTPNLESRHCWDYLSSALVFSVSRQLGRAFPPPPNFHFDQKDNTDEPMEMDLSHNGCSPSPSSLFVHSPYSASPYVEPISSTSSVHPLATSFFYVPSASPSAESSSSPPPPS